MSESIINQTLSTELYWLLLTTIMTSLFWVPYIINRLREQGILAGFWDPEGITSAKAKWAERMMQAHTNAIENLAIFAPLVLILHAMEISTSATVGACMAYFFVRAGHYVVFSLGVPVVRIVLFLTGFGCQMVLVLTLTGMI